MNEDIFNNLLDIESVASNMLFEAQVQSDEKIAIAKKEVENKYNVAHDAIIKELESDFEKQKNDIDVLAKKELDEYVKKLHSFKMDYEVFNSVINSYFFPS